MTRLDDFGFLSITGKDALKFLQGYLTSDLNDLTDTRSAIGAVCNLQGRMVTSGRVVSLADGFLVRMDRDLIAPTMAFLKKYIVFSKAEMVDCSQSLSCFGVIGDQAGYPQTEREYLHSNDLHIIRVEAGPRFEVWSPNPDFSLPGVDLDRPDLWWNREIDSGFAWVSATTQNEFIPQMFDYHAIGAIDFDKGCYLGQEIVARMQYRGSINRRLHRGTATTLVKPGDVLNSIDGKVNGMIVTVSGQNFLAVVQAKDSTTPESVLATTGEPVSLSLVRALPAT